MAIQSLNCPNCMGQIQLDDSKEIGYCSYCGSAIQIKDYTEKIRVEHVVDDSKKMNNSITLANRAFTSGNYEECYAYCSTALECDVDNAHITFLKGLSAAYMSFSRTTELETAIDTAVDIIERTSKNPAAELHLIFADLLCFIKITYKLDCERPKGFTYPDLVTASNVFDVIMTLTRLSNTCALLITDDMIEANPSYEADKKECLEQGIALCKLGDTSVKYQAGYETVKKGDSYVQEPVYKKMSSHYEELHKDYAKDFKALYNNLPSTRKALAQFDGEIEQLQMHMDNYDARFEEYLQANPDIADAYKQNPANMFRRLFGKAKTRKEILSELPAELAELKAIHDQSKDRLRAVNQEKNAFMKQNILK